MQQGALSREWLPGLIAGNGLIASSGRSVHGTRATAVQGSRLRRWGSRSRPDRCRPARQCPSASPAGSGRPVHGCRGPARQSPGRRGCRQSSARDRVKSLSKAIGPLAVSTGSTPRSPPRPLPALKEQSVSALLDTMVPPASMENTPTVKLLPESRGSLTGPERIQLPEASSPPSATRVVHWAALIARIHSPAACWGTPPNVRNRTVSPTCRVSTSAASIILASPNSFRVLTRSLASERPR